MSPPRYAPHKSASCVPRRICTKMFRAVLLIAAKTKKQSKYLSSVECIGKLWFIHTVERCIAMKMKTTAACNGKDESHNIMLSEKARL